jgi:hypothetical protein
MPLTETQRNDITTAIKTHSFMKGNRDYEVEYYTKVLTGINLVLDTGVTNNTPQGFETDICIDESYFAPGIQTRDEFFSTLARIICEDDVQNWRRVTSGAPGRSYHVAGRIEYHWETDKFERKKHFSFFTQRLPREDNAEILYWHFHVANVIGDGYASDGTDPASVDTIFSILNNLHTRLQQLELKTQ